MVAKLDSGDSKNKFKSALKISRRPKVPNNNINDVRNYVKIEVP